MSENRFTLDVAGRDEATGGEDVCGPTSRPNPAGLSGSNGSPRRLARRSARPATTSSRPRAERFREDWVNDELVKAGTARALSLGWPDAYPFTKALGEKGARRTVGSLGTDHHRPTVHHRVALTEPRPGWIRGFRMAEPIIIS